MKRGEIWTLRDDGYASKARPAIIIQNDSVDGFDSTIVCLITAYDSSNIPTRHRLDPDELNGLREVSYVMTDKIVTVSSKMLGKYIGCIREDDIAAIGRKLAYILDV